MAVDNVDEGSNSNLSPRSDREPDGASPPPRAVRALSWTQERNPIDYLEARFLDVTRNFKKRCALSWTLPPLSLPNDIIWLMVSLMSRADPTSNLQTLPSYLEAPHHLLWLILQIPPVDPSSPLRTTLLLRLTSDVLCSVPGYGPALEPTALPLLLNWLTDLNAAWLAVLRAQAWDPSHSRRPDALLPDGKRSRVRPSARACGACSSAAPTRSRSGSRR